MAVNNLPFPLVLILFLVLFFKASANTSKGSSQDLVQTLCVHASYPDICLRTLSSYAGQANTPKDLAEAAVQVSLKRATKLSGYLGNLQSGSQKEQGALRDCVEQITGSVDELSKTLTELQHLHSSTFGWQMSNAQTWVSAALTDDDTCLDGFKEVKSRVRSDVKRKVTDVARVTSNALYLINRLDETRV
ncbi:Pectinesterase [Bertholletia excelsa]